MIPARYPRSLPTKHDNCSLAPHPARPDFSCCATWNPVPHERASRRRWSCSGTELGHWRTPLCKVCCTRQAEGSSTPTSGSARLLMRGGDGRRTPARPSCSRLRAVVGVCRTGVETDVRRAARGRWGHWCSRRARLPDAAGAPGGNARRNWRSGTRDRAGGLHERADGGAPPDPGLPKLGVRSKAELAFHYRLT